MSDERKPSPKRFFFPFVEAARAESSTKRAEEFVSNLAVRVKKTRADFESACTAASEAAALLAEARRQVQRQDAEGAKPLLDRIEKAEAQLLDELPSVCDVIRPTATERRREGPA